MKNIILTLVLMVAGWIQGRIKIKLDYYQDAIKTYRSRRLGDLASSLMDHQYFTEFAKVVVVTNQNNHGVLSLKQALDLYIYLLRCEIKYAKEIDELERSVSVHRLVAAFFA